MRYLVGIFCVGLSACGMVPNTPQETVPSEQQSAPSTFSPTMTAEAAARQFIHVVETVEPVAETECRARVPNANCDFNIVIDDREGQAPNAFQTLDKEGRPVLAFNIPLIATVRNADELAFVMGHEAAHHIQGHIARQQRNAAAGGIILAGLATLTGAGTDAVQTAQELGSAVGARSYSKDFELEADSLGTVIAHKAGYDPVLGAEFFTRISDPGNQFLGTHPPNAARISTVRTTAATLQ